jgi:hypothetical protein
VPALTVDVMCDRYGVPDLVFLDVEGFEWRALAGASRTLARGASVLREMPPNVWQSGEMALRWTAAGMLEAERQSRRSSATSSWPSSPWRSSVISPSP